MKKKTQKVPAEQEKLQSDKNDSVISITPTPKKNVLLVYPRFPITYWGLQHGLRIIGKKAALPPLGLLTLAALLPKNWCFRLVDLNTSILTDNDILWADAVFTGGMLIQADSIHEIVARANNLNITSVVGGPAPSSTPDLFNDADIVFCGEAENRVAELVDAMSQSSTKHRVLIAPPDYPDMKTVPVPRFDLLDICQYASMSLQYSRGCPFQCEFCDIIEIFGRSTRIKNEEQVIAELEAMFQLGYRGTVFFVDDNFIGNLKAVKKLLPVIINWQKNHGRPFEFYTEAGIGLAMDSELMRDMVDAGFTSVFIGIETTSTYALEQAKKFQNLRMEPSDAIDRITQAGLEVMGGFIVGFDSDTEETISEQQSFLSSQPIPIAMVGILMALPGTALWRRLKSEGRLRSCSTGDQFSKTNFVPVMNERTLIQHYAMLMAHLYSPKEYYKRCEKYLNSSPQQRISRTSTVGEIIALLRAIWHVGIVSSRRFMFWRLITKAFTKGRAGIRQAVVHAVQGEHFIRYTEENLLPRLLHAANCIQIRKFDTESPNQSLTEGVNNADTFHTRRRRENAGSSYQRKSGAEGLH